MINFNLIVSCLHWAFCEEVHGVPKSQGRREEEDNHEDPGRSSNAKVGDQDELAIYS